MEDGSGVPSIHGCRRDFAFGMKSEQVDPSSSEENFVENNEFLNLNDQARNSLSWFLTNELIVPEFEFTD